MRLIDRLRQVLHMRSRELPYVDEQGGYGLDMDGWVGDPDEEADAMHDLYEEEAERRGDDVIDLDDFRD
jgi:hypothetical protein